MDIDRVYRLMGSALKRVYGYYVKRPLQRFNVDNRAEKIVEIQQTVPKSAPRHQNTDHLFKQIVKNNPQFRKELNQKPEDLLKRLNSVKVVSKDREISEQEIQEMEEIRRKVKNRLPQSREGTDIPIHAYIEPDYIPKGRISLIRALDFIGKHANKPEEYDSQTIAKQCQLNVEDVNSILEYFKPFYKEKITDPVEDTEKVLGIPKQRFTEIISYLKPKSLLERERIQSCDQNKSENQIKQKKENND